MYGKWNSVQEKRLFSKIRGENKIESGIQN